MKLMPIEVTDQFVLNGCSAGGLGVYTWVEYFRELVSSKNPKTKFFGFADSGFFMDYKNVLTGDNDYTIKMTNLYNLVNANTPFPNQKCVQANPSNPQKCFLAQNLIDYIDSPLFIIQTPYDTW